MNDEIKILLFSDTHSQHRHIKIPNDIDIMIFAGDAGTYKNPIMNVNGILDFIEWYGSIDNVEHKIWIAGNHDTSIESKMVDAAALSKEKGLIYLQHESVTIHGLEIFGSPYTPRFWDWAFNVDRDKLENYWNEIPTTTDVLVIHGGAHKIGGLSVCEDGEDVGCEALTRVINTNLKDMLLMVSGHIHEAYGHYQEEPNSTLFVNASVLNEEYRCTNNPYVITMNIKDKKIISIENH